MKALAVSYITGEEGLEPPSTVLETAALPLNYSPVAFFSTPDYNTTERKGCQSFLIKNPASGKVKKNGKFV